MTKPTKKAEHAASNAGHHAVKVVTNHRLAGGDHSTVFPHNPHWHGGARNGHAGTHTVSSKGKK